MSAPTNSDVPNGPSVWVPPDQLDGMRAAIAANRRILGLPPQEKDEFEQECERCGGYFEASEETSLCPECEAA